jgi:hypothetical protein
VSVGTFAVGTRTVAASLTRSTPVAAITSPVTSETVDTVRVTPIWTYTSPTGRDYYQYRVRLYNQAQTLTFYDTGWTVGTDLTLEIPVVLAAGSGYVIGVAVGDVIDQGDEVTVSFFANAGSDINYDALQSVGRIYEVGINGVGYMLADMVDSELRYQSRMATLETPRFATGDTPFTQAVDRYTFVGFTSFHAGAGQVYRDRTDADPTRFLDSEGVDPFEPGVVRPLDAMTNILTSAYTSLRTVVAQDTLYVQTADDELTYQTTPGTDAGTVSIAAAGSVWTSLATDGQFWYVADGADIYRGTTSDPGAAWSTQNAVTVAWAGGRICAAVIASGSTPNRFTTLTDAGAEDVAGGRLTLPAGHTISSFSSGGGYVWFTSYSDEGGAVWAWQIGSSDAPTIAYEFPALQRPVAVQHYQGSVFIRTLIPFGANSTAVIYQAVQQAAVLSPAKVLDIGGGDPEEDYGPGVFNASDRFVFFSWPYMTQDGVSGIGAVDLASGGFARWFQGSSALGGAVTDITFWRGKAVIAIGGSGVFRQSATKLTECWIKTSVVDLTSNLQKYLDTLDVSVNFFNNANQSIDIDYSSDAGNSYVATGLGPLAGNGSPRVTYDWQLQVRSISLRFTLNNFVGDMVFEGSVLKLHPAGLTDEIITLPINCSDNGTGLAGALLAESKPGAGTERALVLKNLLRTRVLFQDVDYARTGTTQVYEVVDVNVVERAHVYSHAQGQQTHAQVAIVTLRRPVA